MEGLVVMGILYLVFKSLIKRAKTVQQQFGATKPAGAETTAATQAKKPQVSQSVKTQARPKAPAAPRPAESTEGEAVYRPIQPMVQVSPKREVPQGSLFAPEPEGRASSEGVGSGEGTDTCEPSLGHSRITPRLVYATRQAEPAMDVLPASWNGETVVQAVVMNEIFNRREGWSKRNG